MDQGFSVVFRRVLSRVFAWSRYEQNACDRAMQIREKTPGGCLLKSVSGGGFLFFFFCFTPGRSDGEDVEVEDAGYWGAGRSSGRRSLTPLLPEE